VCFLSEFLFSIASIYILLFLRVNIDDHINYNYNFRTIENIIRLRVSILAVCTELCTKCVRVYPTYDFTHNVYLNTKSYKNLYKILFSSCTRIGHYCTRVRTRIKNIIRRPLVRKTDVYQNCYRVCLPTHTCSMW